MSYPGLESDPYNAAAKKYLTGRGMGCMLMFSLNGGYDDAVRFIDSLKLAIAVCNNLRKRLSLYEHHFTHSLSLKFILVLHLVIID